MKPVNIKREVQCTVDEAVLRVTEALKSEGFGILTRIDLHAKFKEALNKDILPAVILGACKPSLAYDVFVKNTDVASILPCNVVVRDLGGGRVSVEMAKATAMLEVLGDAQLVNMVREADVQLARALGRV